MSPVQSAIGRLLAKIIKSKNTDRFESDLIVSLCADLENQATWGLDI